jgi:hypothetical protein
MEKIVFQGKEYDSLADMPAQVRHNYFKAKAGYDVPEDEPEAGAVVMPSGMESMPDEVREIYERVRGEIDVKPVQATPVDKLPKTEDLYRRSAPPGMRNQPSDESVYQPSPPLFDAQEPAIEEDQSLRRMLIALSILLLLGGAVLYLFLGS